MKSAAVFSLLAATAFLCSCASSRPDIAARSGKSHSLAVKSAGQEWSAQSDKNSPALHGILWKPAGNQKGVVVCLHGIQTHAAWFGPLGRSLASQGWTVIAPDRRGSGSNSAAPFRHGHSGGKDILLEDLRAAMRSAESFAPGKPVILLGTSWGSNLASAYVAAGISPQPAGLVQLVPATKVRDPFDPSCFGKSVVRAAAAVLPLKTFGLPFGKHHYLAGQDQEKFHAARKPLPPVDKKTGEKPDEGQAASNKEIEIEIARDPAMLNKPAASTLAAGLALTDAWTGAARSIPDRLPVLVITANCDQIMNNQGARDVFGDAKKSVTFVCIAGGHGMQLTHSSRIAGEIDTWSKSGRKRK